MTNIFHPKPEINPDTEPGCGYMQEMLSGLADGTAGGITKWYAERHVEQCPHCAAALTGLQRLRARLRASGALSPTQDGDTTAVSHAMKLLSSDRLAALEAKWTEVDRETNS
ncbi:MAG: hypothetical protein H8F28_22665 [Fibrella sp.]|nr:hypothetical protein [Armatimonadota bacterium]